MVSFHTTLCMGILKLLRIIPFAAVVTPGSLSVLPVPTTTPKMLQVPQPLYDSTDYGHRTPMGNFALTVNDRILKLAYATASTAQPISFQPSYPNQTYHLQFNGPAVKCDPANDTFTYNISSLYGGYNAGDKMFYRSWVPGSEGDSKGPGTETFAKARLFIMSQFGSSNTVLNISNTPRSLVNLTECVLYNATYDVDFNFQSTQQTQNVNISSWLNPVSVPISNYNISDTVVSYYIMMKAFGTLLVGQEIHSHYNFNSTLYTSRHILNVDWDRSEAVETDLVSWRRVCAPLPVCMRSFCCDCVSKERRFFFPLGVGRMSRTVIPQC